MTLVYPPQQSLNSFFISRLPTSHLATTYVTATVKQTPIIPKRCDSNPPVSPLKALETQVLQWHVSACQTQSRQHQQRKVTTFVLSLKMDSPWDVGFQETSTYGSFVCWNISTSQGLFLFLSHLFMSPDWHLLCLLLKSDLRKLPNKLNCCGCNRKDW